MYIKTEQIRRLRREKDFSQDYMAEILEISQPQYSRIENGESSIDLEKTSKIAEILEVDPFDIIEFSDKQEFINCTQSGNINTIYNNESFEKERQAYLDQIKELKEDKEFLKQENLSLKKMLEKLIQ
ncbi:helix-turn-helix transcriptional regulator [Chryseobacterium mucoviscidosis]|uniref:helix-turn-helix domain-containing protein n=1 Tax=Chryseobacterium mucoviscidosis TaxID=1945581 RepID=UPI0031DFDA39